MNSDQSRTFKFPEYGSNYSFAKFEEDILAYWKKQNVFERSLEKAANEKDFYFYDGPPFATGLPHYGHILAGTIKDIVPRYWSMRGYKVARRFGWDCHGLPVEFEMEKTLGLSGGVAIQEHGVHEFNEACRGIVLRYTDEWRKSVERMGRWVDMDNDYKTMDPSFMESVWWVFKRLWDQGLIYQGKKVVPYSWRLTAPLSNFEASQNYKSVQDPAITVLLKLRAAPKKWATTGIAIWTTTPWTLPANLAVAIQRDPSKLSYSRYKLKDVKGDLTHVIVGDFAAEMLGLTEKEETVSSEELLGLQYQPLFSVFDDEQRGVQGAFRVIDGSDFVVEGQGTGIVHTAPGHGEVDFYACQKEGIEAEDPTDLEGKYLDVVSQDSRLKELVGCFVKDADKKIIALLKDAQQLLKQDTLQHSYPFCERSDTPLIYKSISSWFVRIDEDFKKRMQKNNQKIRWVPEHIKEGRFGKWLDNARDWCISRNRFWGTPLPVWICQNCEHKEVFSSAQELEAKVGAQVSDLHKHFVDQLQFDCSECAQEKSMKRTSEVLDCWFESGSMPYAQEHYPFENKEKLEKEFPADFIAEGLDQTRGWFYTLTVLSTALFDKPAFENCIVNGIVLAEDGRKMSKRLKNYPDPMGLFDRYGADALRLYLAQSPAMYGESLRFSEKNLVELMRAVMIPLWNAYSFFSSYANIDGWSASREVKDCEDSLLDKWIKARIKETEKRMHQEMESYHLYEVAPLLISFVDDLTNWYIRLNRNRFWSEKGAESEADKEAAYQTLYYVLKKSSLCIAPVLPYLSETLHAALQGVGVSELKERNSFESVHELNFENIEGLSLNSEQEAILRKVANAKKIILLGRSLRGEAKIGLRQPLQKMIVAGLSSQDQKELLEVQPLVCKEVNVKELVLVEHASDLVEESARPNFKTLGRKLGKEVKDLQKVLVSWGSKELRDFEAKGSFDFNGHQLNKEDIEIVRRAQPGKLALADYGLVAELDLQLNEGLIKEGLQREIINRIQQRRKEMSFNLTDRIELKFWATSGSLLSTVLKEESLGESHLIARETLCVAFSECAEEAFDSPRESLAEHGDFLFALNVKE